MTHLFDTSAILAHHLAESGADRVQALFDDETNQVGICIVSFLEFEVRLREMGLSDSERQGEERTEVGYKSGIKIKRGCLEKSG